MCFLKRIGYLILLAITVSFFNNLLCMSEEEIWEDDTVFVLEEDSSEEERAEFSITLKPNLQNNLILKELINLVNLPYYMENYAGIWDLRNKELIPIIIKLNNAYTLNNLQEAQDKVREVAFRQVKEFTYLEESQGKKFYTASKKINQILQLMTKEIERMEMERINQLKELETSPGPPVLKQ